MKMNHLFYVYYRFEDDESQSEPDDEIVLPKKARIITANIIGKNSKNPH